MGHHSVACPRWWPPFGGEKTFEILQAIAAIIEHETGGDPVSGLKWTRKTTAKIAKQLRRIDIRVSDKTVGRLLNQMKLSLRINLKSLESGLRKPLNSRQRDQHFRYIRNQIRIYSMQGLPVISVDIKSRELIGEFHQSGRKWSQEPI